MIDLQYLWERICIKVGIPSCWNCGTVFRLKKAYCGECGGTGIFYFTYENRLDQSQKCGACDGKGHDTFCKKCYPEFVEIDYRAETE